MRRTIVNIPELWREKISSHLKDAVKLRLAYESAFKSHQVSLDAQKNRISIENNDLYRIYGSTGPNTSTTSTGTISSSYGAVAGGVNEIHKLSSSSVSNNMNQRPLVHSNGHNNGKGHGNINGSNGGGNVMHIQQEACVLLAIQQSYPIKELSNSS